MSQNTSIEWTGSTWNPIRARLPEAIALHQIGGIKRLEAGRWGYHCEHVSPGCVNCYAEAMNKRTLPAWGTGLAFNVPNRSRVEIFLDEKELVKPLHWKKPTKIFPCSMTDLFAEFVSDEMIDRMFAVMALCPQHTFQLLSKRAARMRDYFADIPYRQEVIGIFAELWSGLDRHHDATAAIPEHGVTWQLPFSNVHMGVSVEDQQCADERIPHLLQTPAAVRWVSYEPALGPVDFTRIGGAELVCMSHGPTYTNALTGDEVCPKCGVHSHRWYKGIDWGVYGGESGRGARPNDIAWARSFIRQFHAANLPAFVKQLGLYPVDGLREDAIGVHPTSKDAPASSRAWERGCFGERIKLKDRKGGEPSEWPSDLRVREMPEVPR